MRRNEIYLSSVFLPWDPVQCALFVHFLLLPLSTFSSFFNHLSDVILCLIFIVMSILTEIPCGGGDCQFDQSDVYLILSCRAVLHSCDVHCCCCSSLSYCCEPFLEERYFVMLMGLLFYFCYCCCCCCSSLLYCGEPFLEQRDK